MKICIKIVRKCWLTSILTLSLYISAFPQQQFNLFQRSNTPMPGEISKDLIKGQLLEPNLNLIQTIYNQEPDQFSVVIPLHEGKSKTFVFNKRKITTDNFKVVTSDGRTFQGKAYTGVHYQIAEGGVEKVGGLSFTQNEVSGMFSDDEGNWNIGKLPGSSGPYVVYCERDLKVSSDFHCDTEDKDDPIKSTDGKGLGSDKSVQSSGTCREVQVYFECDFKMYQDNASSVSNVSTKVTSIFSYVKQIYQIDQVDVALSQIFVWTTTDPYAAFISSSQYLPTFAVNRPTFNGHLAHFLTTRSNGLGGLAYVGGLCNTGAKYAFSNIFNTFSALPTYSWTVNVIAHEMGHNFGSKHTHWCGWQLTPTTIGRIDSCAVGENVTGSVNCGSTKKSKINGTVMSYCHNNGAINLNLGFGPLPGDAIRNGFNNATCLSGAPVPKFVIKGSRVICEGEAITLNATTTTTGASFAWTGPNGFTSTSQNPSISTAGLAAAGSYLCTMSKGGCSSDPSAFAVVVNGNNSPPINETFEGSFPPVNWRISNPNNDRTFVKSSLAGGFGTSANSISFDNYNLPNINARRDTLYLPNLNLTGLSGGSLSFDVAHASNGFANDSLVVAVSTNCGRSFTRLYRKGGAGLATAPDNINPFTPTNTQWRKETISLSAYNGLASVQICIINISGASNFIYLDNVNLTTSGGAGTPSISLNVLTQSAYCPGASLNLGFSTAGTFNGGNTFTAQLSNASGSFSSPVNIGSGSSSPITATIPAGTTSGSGYLIRIISSNPNVSSGTSSSLNISPLVVDAGVNGNICVGASSVTLTGSPSGGTWSGNGITSGGVFTPAAGLVGNQILTYSVSSGGCSGSDQLTYTVKALPTVVPGSNASTCSSSSPFSLTGFSPTGGTWSGNGVSGAGLFTPSAALIGVQTLTYTIVSNGCSNSGTRTMTVSSTITVSAGSNQSVCSNAAALNLSGSPSGGTWSGAGITPSGLFTPSSSLAGNNTLTYTVTGTCGGSSQITMNVKSAPSANAGIDQNYCINEPAFTISQGSPAGGDWSGPGVSGGIFNAGSVSAGTYTLTYTTNQNGCSNSASVDFTVNSIPNPTLGNDQTACAGSGNVTLTPSIPGGTWTGNGVSSAGVFTPSSGNIGANNLTYTVIQNGCSGSASMTFTVNPIPAVSAGPDQSATSNASDVTLTGTPAGGTWSGTAVSASGVFSPSSAGQGNFTLSYTYILNGCSVTDNLIFTVLPSASVTAGSDITICETSAPVTLVGSPAGGTWSGNGVDASGVFTPGSGLIGAQTLTYTVGGNGSDDVIVNVVPVPTVSAGSDQTICSTAPNFSLVGASPAGGTWSGTGITSAGVVTTSQVSAAGSVFTYSFSQNGCSASGQVTITKVSPPTVNAGANQNICKNATPIQLNGTPSGGTWSGSGVNSSGLFDPGTTSSGNKTLTYTVQGAISGCAGTDQLVISVFNIPTVSAGADRTTCSNSTSFSLVGTPAGGSWSGPGINTGGLFTPTSGLTGIQTVSYTVSQNGCSNSSTTNVTVNAPPVVTAGPNQNYCTNTPGFSLTGASPAGGTWSGAGFVNASGQCTGPFTTGNYNLTYTASQNGCTASDQLTISIGAAPIVNAGSNRSVCSNGTNLTLNGFSPAGGVWSGNGVSAAGVFSPSEALTGNQVLTYTVNLNGCSGSSQLTVNVKAIPVITTGANETACESGMSFKINGYSPRGGKWTGPGVYQDSLYAPGNALVGTQTLTYSVTRNGCTNFSQKTITVTNGNSITLGTSAAQLCSNGIPTTFSGFLPSGGTWKGAGISPAGLLTPASNLVGAQTYTYRLDLNGCRDSVQVQTQINAVPTVNAGSDISVCATGASVTLTNATPAGGIWSGPGVNDSGVFDPTLVTAGLIGLTYTFTGNGCIGTDGLNVNVSASPNVTAGNDRNICKNSVPVTLVGSPFGGTWTGNGVTAGGVFTPTSTMSGNITLTYSINENGCTGTDPVIISITNAIAINAGQNQTVCDNQSAFNLTGASPSGGTWTGTGVTTTGNFNPIGLAAGPITLVYRATQNNCTALSSKTITVNAAPTVTAGTDVSICSNASPLQLSGFSPAGGTWSGNSVSTAGLITPSAANTGLIPLTYTFSQNGCTDSDTRIVTVVAAPEVNAGPSQTICGLTGPVAMTGFFPSNGVWSGNGITQVGNFTPVAGNLGSNVTVTYTVTQNGCSAQADKTINVVNIPTSVPVTSSSEIACAGQILPLALTLTNPASFNIQWKKNGVIIAGATDSDYQATTSGNYLAEVKSGSCAVISDEKILTFNPIPATPSVTVSGLVLSSSSPANNQWKRNGQNIPGATNQQYTPVQSGIFTVVVTNGGCESNISQGVPFTVVSTVEEMSNLLEINIYPNPSEGQIHLEARGLKSAQVEAKLMDVLGKTLWNQSLISNEELEISNEIQLPKLPAGAYWLQLTDGKQRHLRKIILK